MAIQSIPILTLESANLLVETLEDFLSKSEANFAMVIDRGGAVLSQCGDIPPSVDPTIIAALAAGSFAATRELALRVGEAEFRALHQQGEHSQIFMCGVDDDTVFVTMFGPQSTLGLVRFYSARTVKRIGTVLQENRSHQLVTPLFSEQDVRAATSIFGR